MERHLIRMIIPEKTQQTIQTLYEGGRSIKDISEVTGIPVPEINTLKRKGQWKKSEGLMIALQNEIQKGETSEAQEIMLAAESAMSSGGKEHAEMVFKQVHASLKALKKMPPLKTWKDIETADRIARRAAGMDKENGGGNTIINLGIVAGGFRPREAALKKVVDVD